MNDTRDYGAHSRDHTWETTMGRPEAGRDLDFVLAELLARTGAQAARVVDGRTGTVVAEVGVQAGDDVATLVRLAHEAGPLAASDGGLDDLVVATRTAVHVLRMTDVPGTFLHIRLDNGRGDVAAARRGMATVVLPSAVRQALVAAPPAGYPAVPAPLPAAPLPAEPRNPALASLAAGPPVARSGVLAAMALAAHETRSLTKRTPLASVLPPRSAVPPVTTPAVLRQRWAHDDAMLRRVVTGLRRLP
ncbi:MAG: hypothetical protein LH603_14520 [Pseudonocardia sp.]|nr:hypothetical protein [Pseudonocardia sp.]